MRTDKTNVSHKSPIDSFIEVENMVRQLVNTTCVSVYYFHIDCNEEIFVETNGKYFHWSFDCGLLSGLESGEIGSDFKLLLAQLFLIADSAEMRSM